MSELESIEKLRELAADINSNEIVDHMQLYPSCVFDGHWLDAWHREFDRLIEAIQAEVDERYMPLPVDADGAPFKPGDTAFCDERPDGFEVYEVSFTDGEGTRLYDRHGKWALADACSHSKPRTVEDVLKDVVRVFTGRELDYMGEVERYEFAKYASELRMRDAE